MIRRISILNFLLLIVIARLPAVGISQSWPEVAPEAKGFSSAWLDQAQQQVQYYVDEQHLSGVVTVVARQGKVIHARAYGMRDVEHQTPMTFDTLFRLASMTKPITSVALMMLAEEGKVRLDAPVAEYLPAYAGVEVYAGEGRTVPPARPISVRDVLMHTSGLTAGSFGDGPVQDLYRASRLDASTTLESFVDRLAALPLMNHPGERWNYGYSTDVVARIVEVVSGWPFEAFVTQRILVPLAMHNTGFTVPEEDRDRLAVVYRSQSENGLERVDVPPGPSFPRGVGGMYSTAADYLRFAQMLLDGGTIDGVRLLRPETVALMTRNHLPESLIPIRVLEMDLVNNGFGLGFSVVVGNEPGLPDEHGFWWNQQGRPPIGSYWWIGAFQNYFWVDPTHEIIGLIMTQSTDLMPYDYKQEFHTQVYEAFRGEAVHSGSDNRR